MTSSRPWAIWEAPRRETVDLHIVPLSDTSPHILDYGCNCSPEVVQVHETLIHIHFAHDGRDPMQKLWRQ